MTSETPKYESAEKFFFETPPYDKLSVTRGNVRAIFGDELRLDGYCPVCRQKRTFNRTSGGMGGAWIHQFENGLVSSRYGELRLTCAREDNHVLHFHLWLANNVIQKVGQFPSFADIALDESKTYDKLLSKKDVSEFHRAIGLAAHNIGIGSFVYLRRIFERLIDKRYKEFKDTENWKDEEYYKLRMAERVAFLKTHLPPFLVKNAKIYSILSVGIHELEEEQCLAFFPILRQSLILILEEDKKKQEELNLQKELEKAISNFNNPGAKPTLGSVAELGKALQTPEK